MIQLVPFDELPTRRSPQKASKLAPLVEELIAAPQGHAVWMAGLAPAKAVRLGQRLQYLLRDRGYSSRTRAGDGGLYAWITGKCEVCPSRRRKTVTR